MHPEKSLEEFETAKRIRAELDAMGIPWIEATPTGTIGIINGNGKCGKTIGLRADIDALEVTETNGTEFDSQVPGLAHACGHDSHASMLLGAAKVFKEIGFENIPGRIYLIFQPAEELACGAEMMVKTGKLNDMDAVFGQHIWAPENSGSIFSRRGPLMAGATMFKITVNGKGGHGSAMDRCKDPILGAAAIEMALQTVVSQDVSGNDQASLCIGKMWGGTRFNVVPDQAFLEGNIRYLQLEAGDVMKKRIAEIVEFTAKSYGLTADLEIMLDVPPTYNDDEMFELIKAAAVKLLGKDGFCEPLPNMGSEDFPHYAEICPAGFAFVGSKNEAKGIVCAHHTSTFRIDEDALPGGAAMYVQVAMDYFDSKMAEAK